MNTKDLHVILVVVIYVQFTMILVVKILVCSFSLPPLLNMQPGDTSQIMLLLYHSLGRRSPFHSEQSQSPLSGLGKGPICLPVITTWSHMSLCFSLNKPSIFQPYNSHNWLFSLHAMLLPRYLHN